MTFANSAIAEQNIAKTAVPKNIEQRNSNQTIDESDRNLYKLLYENSAKSNANIISTIQWSIGIISTFVIVLLGSQILFNYRVNKEEIRAIRSELEEKFHEFKTDLISNSNKERKELIEKFELKFSNNEKNIKDTISQHYSEKDKYIDAKFDSFNKDISNLKSQLKFEVKYLKIDIEKVGGEVWKIKGVNANALRNFIHSINLHIDTGLDLKHELDDIIETLQNMTSISKNLLTDLVKTLERVPEEYQTKKLKIKELYSSMPQYIYVDDPNRPGYLKTVDI